MKFLEERTGTQQSFELSSDTEDLLEITVGEITKTFAETP